MNKKKYFTIFKKNFDYPKTIIDYFNNNKKITVISFSSIGRGRKYIQQNEFFKLTKKYNVMFVKDITRSWFNNIDIKYIKSFLKKNNKIYLYDDNKIKNQNLEIKKKLIQYQDIIHEKIDCIIISPGIDIKKCRLKNFLKKNHGKIHTDLDVFYYYYKKNKNIWCNISGRK